MGKNIIYDDDNYSKINMGALRKPIPDSELLKIAYVTGQFLNDITKKKLKSEAKKNLSNFVNTDYNGGFGNQLSKKAKDIIGDAAINSFVDFEFSNLNTVIAQIKKNGLTIEDPFKDYSVDVGKTLKNNAIETGVNMLAKDFPALSLGYTAAAIFTKDKKKSSNYMMKGMKSAPIVGNIFKAAERYSEIEMIIMQDQARYAAEVGDRYSGLMTLQNQTEQLKTALESNENEDVVQQLRAQVDQTQNNLNQMGVTIHGKPVSQMDLKETTKFSKDIQNVLSFYDSDGNILPHKVEEIDLLNQGVQAGIQIMDGYKNQYRISMEAAEDSIEEIQRQKSLKQAQGLNTEDEDTALKDWEKEKQNYSSLADRYDKYIIELAEASYDDIGQVFVNDYISKNEPLTKEQLDYVKAIGIGSIKRGGLFPEQFDFKMQDAMKSAVEATASMDEASLQQLIKDLNSTVTEEKLRETPIKDIKQQDAAMREKYGTEIADGLGLTHDKSIQKTESYFQDLINSNGTVDSEMLETLESLSMDELTNRIFSKNKDEKRSNLQKFINDSKASLRHQNYESNQEYDDASVTRWQQIIDTYKEADKAYIKAKAESPEAAAELLKTLGAGGEEKLFEGIGQEILAQNEQVQYLAEGGRELIARMGKKALTDFRNNPDKYIDTSSDSTTMNSELTARTYANIINGYANGLAGVSEEGIKAIENFMEKQDLVRNSEITIGEYEDAFNEMVEAAGASAVTKLGLDTTLSNDKTKPLTYHRNDHSNLDFKERIYDAFDLIDKNGYEKEDSNSIYDKAKSLTENELIEIESIRGQAEKREKLDLYYNQKHPNTEQPVLVENAEFRPQPQHLKKIPVSELIPAKLPNYPKQDFLNKYGLKPLSALMTDPASQGVMGLPKELIQQYLQTTQSLQKLTQATEDYDTVRTAVDQGVTVSNEKMLELAQSYEGIEAYAQQTADGWQLQEGALDSVTEKLTAQRDELQKQMESKPMQEVKSKIVSFDERLEKETDIERARQIVTEKKNQGFESAFNDEELERYVTINKKLAKANTQLEKQQLQKEKKELEQTAKKKSGNSGKQQVRQQVVQQVNPLAEYMDLVNHKKNMGEYDDNLLKYINDLNYAYKNLAKTQKEKWMLEEQIFQAQKAYRAQLINDVADNERFTKDSYRTAQEYRALLSSGTQFTEKERKELMYRADEEDRQASAEYLKLSQLKYQKTGNEEQYRNDLRWGLENDRAKTEEERWQFNRENEQSLLRQAQFSYERTGNELEFIKALDERMNDITLTEQERYGLLQKSVEAYKKMTEEAKAQRDILKEMETARIEFYKNELSIAVDPQQRSLAYDDLFVAANNTVAEAYTQQAESTRLANLYRDDLQKNFNVWDSDKFFNIKGEINDAALKNQLELLPEGDHKRFSDLIKELSEAKKTWYDMEQARISAISTIQQAYGELQSQQQQAYNKVVDMVRKRKEKELEAIEEVHKKRTEQLDEELKQAEKVYERQLNLLDDLKNADDYQRNLKKETETRDKLQQRIDLLALDDSDSARMQRLELEKQLKEQEERIAQMQREHEYSETRKALEEDLKKQQESIDEMREADLERYEREKEKLDDRYTEEEIDRIANEALSTGKFTEFRDDAVGTYNDIYTSGVKVVQELSNAWKNYAVETGEYFNDINRYEFTNLFSNLNTIMTDMQKLGYWLEAFGYNKNSAFDYGGDAGGGTINGMDREYNYQMLLNDVKYRDDELSRMINEITKRRASGQSVKDQKAYLQSIINMMEIDFRIGKQGSQKYNKGALDAIMQQYYYGINGGVEQEYGEAERLFGYLERDAALRRERIEEIQAYGKIYGLTEGQQSYLDALLALERGSTRSAESAQEASAKRAYLQEIEQMQMNRAAYTPDMAAFYDQLASGMNLTPVIQNTNTVGDVYINVAGAADANTVRALDGIGDSILDQLGTELRGRGLRL